jgi:hypothetical protein
MISLTNAVTGLAIANPMIPNAIRKAKYSFLKDFFLLEAVPSSYELSAFRRYHC